MKFIWTLLPLFFQNRVINYYGNIIQILIQFNPIFSWILFIWNGWHNHFVLYSCYVIRNSFFAMQWMKWRNKIIVNRFNALIFKRWRGRKEWILVSLKLWFLFVLLFFNKVKDFFSVFFFVLSSCHLFSIGFVIYVYCICICTYIIFFNDIKGNNQYFWMLWFIFFKSWILNLLTIKIATM